MGLKYPVELIPDLEVGGFTVEVTDIPSAHTQGEDREEALDNVLSALLDLIELNYFDHNRPVPLPSAFEGENYVEVPEDVTQEIMKFNARLEKLAS